MQGAMVLRPHNIALLVSLVVLALAGVAFAGPLTSSASANACQRFGDQTPMQLSHKHARKAIRCYLNETRQRHGLSHLRKNHRLNHAAQHHTHYMKRHRCFSHECPGEPSVLSRLEKVNYIVGGLHRWAYGENIAYGEKGTGTPKAIYEAWMKSPEHRANILNSSFRQIGIGFARGVPPNPKANGSVFTTDFGLRQH
jgi:uncharacterized protein YkwD